MTISHQSPAGLEAPQSPSAPENGSVPPLLEARNLSCERDDRVLFHNLQLSLRAGGCLQIAGGNGSGKTTLLRILCGLHDSYQGDILWRGHDRAEQAEAFAGDLLYFGHRVGVNKILTPLENLRWAAGLQAQVEERQLLQALAELGLRGFEDSPCYTLSAGQQQRVSLARLRLSRASLWVLDEPFTTLDVDAVAQLESTLQKHAESGGAVLVTTHHPLKLPSLERRVLGGSEGRS